MEVEATSELVGACKQVLAENQHGDFTLPSASLYPHQFLWDSCFIAIGLSNYDTERAQKELKSLLRGQWDNGMLPNMIFSDGDHFRRDRNMWQSWRSPQAPVHLATSGITQPPMLAEAVVRVGKQLDKTARQDWYKDMFPPLLKYHQWLYKERDPHEEGLVLLIHPWESGMDNSPPWINQLHLHHHPWWVRIAETTHVDSLARFFRRDTTHVAPEQRITNIEAMLYYDVVRRLRRKNWDIEGILNRTEFAVQDLTFNCILVRAHDHLKAIAKAIGHEVPDWMDERNQKARTHIAEKLWDEETGQFYSRNFVTHKLIKEPSIATLMPLYAGCITDTQAKRLIELMRDPRQYGTRFPLPSVPVKSDWYHEFGFWQGPAWVNTNWLVIDGAERAGFDKDATHISAQTLELVEKNGPSEYYSAKTGKPAGAKNFSWTAALAIDLASRKVA